MNERLTCQCANATFLQTDNAKYMKIQLPRRKAHRGGFTLIEVLLVIVIIGLLAAAVITQVMPQRASAERDTTTLLITSIKGSLDRYMLNIGHYPTEEEGGLLALLKKPEFENEALGNKWAGPYVKPTGFNDAWGNQLEYVPADPEFRQEGEPPYRLFSQGPDMMPDTEDDVGDKDTSALEEVDSLEDLEEMENQNDLTGNVGPAGNQ